MRRQRQTVKKDRSFARKRGVKEATTSFLLGTRFGGLSGRGLFRAGGRNEFKFGENSAAQKNGRHKYSFGPKGPPSSHGLRNGPPSSHGLRNPPSSHGRMAVGSSHGIRGVARAPRSSHGFIGGFGIRGPPSSHGLGKKTGGSFRWNSGLSRNGVGMPPKNKSRRGYF